MTEELPRVLIADDHPSVREGLRQFLVAGGGVEVVGEAASAAEAVDVGRKVAPDVVLLDLGLPDAEGAAAVQIVRAGLPDVRILVLSGTATPTIVRECLTVGAAGYLEKTGGPGAIRDAILRVASGERVVDPALVTILLDDPTAGLSPRELEVLDAVSQGLTNRQVAARLGTSEHTVKTHLSRAMAKLGAEDRTHAVAMVMRRGILS